MKTLNAKSEIRNPRTERNPKPESRNLPGLFGASLWTFLPCPANRFGLRISGIRLSDFRPPVWLALAMLSLATMPQLSNAAEPRNLIQLENQKPGTTDWLLTNQKGSRPPLCAPDDEPYDRVGGGAKNSGLLLPYEHPGGETLKVYVSTEPRPTTRSTFTGWVITAAKALGS